MCTSFGHSDHVLPRINQLNIQMDQKEQYFWLNCFIICREALWCSFWDFYKVWNLLVSLSVGNWSIHRLRRAKSSLQIWREIDKQAQVWFKTKRWNTGSERRGKTMKKKRQRARSIWVYTGVVTYGLFRLKSACLSFHLFSQWMILIPLRFFTRLIGIARTIH